MDPLSGASAAIPEQQPNPVATNHVTIPSTPQTSSPVQIDEIVTRVFIRYDGMCFPISLSENMNKITSLKEQIKIKTSSSIPALQRVKITRMELIHDFSVYKTPVSDPKTGPYPAALVAASADSRQSISSNDLPNTAKLSQMGIVTDAHLLLRTTTVDGNEFLPSTAPVVPLKPEVNTKGPSQTICQRVFIHYQDVCFPVNVNKFITTLIDLKEQIKYQSHINKFTQDLVAIPSRKLELLHNFDLYGGPVPITLTNQALEFPPTLKGYATSGPNGEARKAISSLTLPLNASINDMVIIQDAHLTVRIISEQEYFEYESNCKARSNPSCGSACFACICAPFIALSYCRETCDCCFTIAGLVCFCFYVADG